MVIEQHKSHMTELNLHGLTDDKKVTPSEERLALALSMSSQTQLETINMMSNKSWWRSPIVYDPLMEFIKNQTALQKLILQNNAFTTS